MSLQSLPTSVSSQLQKRLFEERTAEYFYWAAAYWCRENGYSHGFDYFKNEAHDEKHHFKKLLKYLSDWGINISLPQIEEVPVDFNSLMDVFERAYEMEYNLMLAYQDISAQIFISHMVTFDFLGYYRGIQRKSVLQYKSLIDKLSKYPQGDEIYFDKELK